MTSEQKVKQVYPKARLKDGKIQIAVPAVYWMPITTKPQRVNSRAWADAWRNIQAAKEEEK